MTPEELKEIEERCRKAFTICTPGNPLTGYSVRLRHGFADDLAYDVPALLAYIQELESQIPRWIPITVAVPDEYEIVLFKKVEAIVTRPKDVSMKGSDPFPDLDEILTGSIETRTSYFTGYRIDTTYRDHTHHCVGDYVRLDWVRIFKEK